MSRTARKITIDQSVAGLGTLMDLLGFSLRRGSVMTFAKFSEAIGDKGITPQRYAVLEVVGANPGLQAVQLARALNLSQPAVTVALDFWDERGCIQRARDPDDRRSSTIQLTEHGDQFLADLRDQVIAQDRELASPLSEAEEAELRRLLAKVCRD